MLIPEGVGRCMEALETAGFEAYCVGGCVRDTLLGKQPHDFDLCTSARPERMEEIFHNFRLVLAGEKHGTVGVITEDGVVEITTFRTEGTYADNRHPDKVNFVTDIRQDLSRRDFTVNAMAYSPKRGLIDPFGGVEDLKNRCLRCVGDPETRFREDALRILRGVRFSVTYGLIPEGKTEQAMEALAPLLDHLARERVFSEFCGFLPKITAEELARFAPIITQVIPELRETVGFDQHSPHHKYDLYTHIAHVVEGVPGDVTLRWAALLHDVGKIPTFTRDETGRGHFYGHAQVGARMADDILHRLKAPTALREQAVLLIDQHMTRLQPDRRLVKRYFSRWGRETVEKLLYLQQADMGSKGVPGEEGRDEFALLWQLLREVEAENNCLTLRDLAVNGRDLMALGYRGPAIGEGLQDLLDAVLDEQAPNEKKALLEFLQQRREHSGVS